MTLTNNRKLLIGGAIQITAGIFFLVCLFSLDRLPRTIAIMFLPGLLVGGTFEVMGLIESGIYATLAKEITTTL